MNNNESVWEYYGEKDPYFGVNTVAEMRNEAINDEARKLFFESGEKYISRIWDEIEEHLTADFKPQRALDFGCGVGRILLPIAKRSKEAIGVDISTAMLEEAKKNAEIFNYDNITFIKGDDKLSKVSGEFDFVHSFIVFQHINPKVGERIFQKIVESLSENGIGVLHVQYATDNSTSGQKLRFKLYRDFPIVYSVRNLILRKRKEPLIPMYSYNLNNLMLILQKNNCSNCQVRFSYHGVEGILLFFQKKTKPLF